MKTVYIPAGATYNYETLVTDDVIVHGHLHVTNGLKAKHISGRGFITAGEVSADIVDVTELECGTVICRRLLAQRVSVNEAMISESAAVSRFFSANYVKAPSLTVAVSEIGEADVDEIVHLTPKPRGMLLTLLLSMLRTFWLRLTASRPQGRFEKPQFLGGCGCQAGLRVVKWAKRTGRGQPWSSRDMKSAGIFARTFACFI